MRPVGVDDSVRPYKRHSDYRAEAKFAFGCRVPGVVPLPAPKMIRTAASLRPNRAFKILRAQARQLMFPAPLFAYFFWQDRKSRSAKLQLRYYRILPHAGACQQPLRQNLRFCPLPLHRGGFGRTESSAPTGAMQISRQMRNTLPLAPQSIHSGSCAATAIVAERCTHTGGA